VNLDIYNAVQYSLFLKNSESLIFSFGLPIGVNVYGHSKEIVRSVSLMWDFAREKHYRLNDLRDLIGWNINLGYEIKLNAKTLLQSKLLAKVPQLQVILTYDIYSQELTCS